MAPDKDPQKKPPQKPTLKPTPTNNAAAEDETCCLDLLFRRFDGDFLLQSIERLRAECVVREVARLAEKGYDIEIINAEANRGARSSILCSDCEEAMWGMHLHGDPEGIMELIDTCEEEFYLNLEGIIVARTQELAEEFNEEDLGNIKVILEGEEEAQQVEEQSATAASVGMLDAMLTDIVSNAMKGEWLTTTFAATKGSLDQIRSQVEDLDFVTQFALDDNAFMIAKENKPNEFSLWLTFPNGEHRQDFLKRVGNSGLKADLKSVPADEVLSALDPTKMVQCQNGLAAGLADYFKQN